MNCRHRLMFIFLIGLALWGCKGVQSPSNVVWIAHPEYRRVENSSFSATLEPQKRAFPYYVSFLLTITNKSGADLTVDWNASRYLLNGRPEGVLVFEGIDPATIKTVTVPPETIAPGGFFSRELMPLRRIAWSPLKANTDDQRSITPGILPVGENGIRLVVRHDNELMTVPISIRLDRQASP